jgi:hypothetical protein
MVTRDDVGGVELQVPKALDGFQDRGRGRAHRSVEELRVDRETARLSERDSIYATGTCGCFSGARSRKLTMSSSDSGES